MRSVFALLVAFLVLHTATAATVSVAIVGGRCNSAGDCAVGDKCKNGRCTFSRTGSITAGIAGLPDGSLCLSSANCKNLCRNMRCTGKSGAKRSCVRKSDCKEGLECQKGKCVKPTSDTVATAVPQRTVKKPNGKTCKYNAECRNVCVAGKCADPLDAGKICTRSVQCHDGLVCKNSKCQVKRTRGKPNRAMCNYDFQCKNVCIFGQCVDARGMGGSCVRGVTPSVRLGAGIIP